ncbi:YidB family protein [Pragia fontium]|uniref:Uncharacterized conserved protein YidB, DUF937 family n=2 Tax=Pragia fontium TaxID=82985 RepID=A0AAJ4WDE6_9GAMM|nr:YidB family protein [Pragia fontium]AKJ40773.1 hypothetical protein QQ39_00700 [Pragia fontium]SFD39185.1 Uncharacterized conserved protein YidB, DUF937 family [Pragia fontium DSM 5563 = ATCC 49100]SUB80944.1 Uncharacterized protein conserved in bacteria [Pragia fontium]VEJ52757.1 Uncharacterized protein conserved in bacteria [Pragia fontium]GKX63659.1 hypothetical protein SOASR032_22280 [Pragia fontium]
MGLLDKLGGLLGGSGGNQGSIDYSAILQWIEQQGGISSLLDKFRQGGLTEVVQSWIGTGANLPISGQQVQDILSGSALQQLSEKLGVGSQETSGLIAQYLPDLVDKLSPKGEMPESPDLMSIGMSLLKNKFFS